MHQNGNGCHLWVVHLRMALFFIISYFYKFSATGKCRSHNEERKTREHVKDVSGSDGLWGASGGDGEAGSFGSFPRPSCLSRPSGCAALDDPSGGRSRLSSGRFLRLRNKHAAQGTAPRGGRRTSSALPARGGACALGTLSSRHGTDFLSHAALSGCRTITKTQTENLH